MRARAAWEAAEAAAKALGLAGEARAILAPAAGSAAVEVASVAAGAMAPEIMAVAALVVEVMGAVATAEEMEASKAPVKGAEAAAVAMVVGALEGVKALEATATAEAVARGLALRVEASGWDALAGGLAKARKVLEAEGATALVESVVMVMVGAAGVVEVLAMEVGVMAPA